MVDGLFSLSNISKGYANVVIVLLVRHPDGAIQNNTLDMNTRMSGKNQKISTGILEEINIYLCMAPVPSKERMLGDLNSQ